MTWLSSRTRPSSDEMSARDPAPCAPTAHAGYARCAGGSRGTGRRGGRPDDRETESCNTCERLRQSRRSVPNVLSSEFRRAPRRPPRTSSRRPSRQPGVGALPSRPAHPNRRRYLVPAPGRPGAGSAQRRTGPVRPLIGGGRYTRTTPPIQHEGTTAAGENPDFSSLLTHDTANNACSLFLTLPRSPRHTGHTCHNTVLQPRS